MKKTKIPFNEYFLHYLWNTKQIEIDSLETTAGAPLEIVHFGHYNTDSGPDFLHATVKIDGIVWVGNIEIHVLSSDWKKHRHGTDPAYNNVTLHVVYVEDEIIPGLPCLSLQRRIPKILIQRYVTLLSNRTWIPCSTMISSQEISSFQLWKETLLIEKLEQKSMMISLLLQKYTYDWEQCFYLLLARYFGGKVNHDPFENLAEKVPLDLIRKNDLDPMVKQALFFGQAGLLEGNCNDTYFQRLKEEYLFLQKKYDLRPMNSVVWKLKTLRPYNFPTLRIAEFSTLKNLSQSLFSRLMECKSLHEMYGLLDAEVDPYWSLHFLFGKNSKTNVKGLTPAFKDILLINAFFPLVLVYAKTYGKDELISWIFAMFDTIKSENNTKIRQWKTCGINAHSALESQALLHLHSHYCLLKKCSNCRIGHQILSLKIEDKPHKM